MPVEVDCPGCGTVYRFGEHLLGRTAPCKECQRLLTVRSRRAAETERDEPAPKKKRERVASLGLRWKLPLGLGVFLLFIGGGVTLGLLVAGEGRGPALAGNWKGAPEVRRAVQHSVRGKMDPITAALVQKAADEMLTVYIEFAKDGTVSLSGNTGIIGVPGSGEGSWEIIRRDGKILTVWIVLRDNEFEARLAFTRRNTFEFTRLDERGQSIVFERLKD
jgi:hypothetical protein